MTKRQKAILRRNIFLGFCVAVLILFICLVVFIVSALTKNDKKGTESKLNTTSSQTSSAETSSNEDNSSSENSNSQNTSSKPTPSAPQNVEINGVTLDANFTNLLLVNGKNPLPEDYNYEGNLTTIPKKYIKGSLTQIDKDVWPYLQAMLDAARSENIDIGVWSPYRSYATQKMLFERQVQKQKNNGVPADQAEDKAATIVARPGTSEHHTGLALDINCADHAFEKTAAYKWLKENAENYGFIMRYSAEKQSITGVIHESWHWRFVGINTAKEINRLGMCLEEYVEYNS
jgi:D-alanyl-D-alanine carboxypeptidase